MNAINKQPEINNDFLFQQFEKDLQWNFGIELLKNMHFDFE
jgi:hypothetical protein